MFYPGKDISFEFSIFGDIQILYSYKYEEKK